MRKVALAFILAAGASPAFAHGTGHIAGWALDPVIVVPLVLSLIMFGVGWLRLRRRSHHGADALIRRGGLFLAGWLVLAGALASPLHHFGGRSFAAHMLEHELLMLVAAPFLVLAEPLAIMLWAFPSQGRRALGLLSRAVRRPWTFLTDPIPATALQAAALWLWHVPILFDRALLSPGWHIAQHLSFLITALLFWSAALPARARHPGTAVLCLFVTSIISGALGAMMAFAQSPWYLPYAQMGLAPFALSPIEDQQLAGMLMWVPGGLIHALAALAAMARLLKPPAVTLKPLEASHGHAS